MENLTYPFQLHQRHKAQQADLLSQILKRQASYPEAKQISVSLVTATLKQTHQKEKITAGLLLHSDQGLQYTSQSYFVL